MIYQPDPRMFVENGPALTARRVHRHDAYRILLGTDPRPLRRDCTIRFAL